MITIRDKVRFVETDMMGVVHHANYLRWFEMGRVAYLRACGISLGELMADGVIFPRARVYSSTGGELAPVNSRYIQNVRYLRFKNLTVGYTVPQRLTQKIHLDKVRFYFSGENLAYWSPIKKYTKYLDPESSYRRASSNSDKSSTTGIYKNSSNKDAVAYPWQKTLMFGVDITF